MLFWSELSLPQEGCSTLTRTQRKGATKKTKAMVGKTENENGDVERMNQQQEEEDDQGDYEEPGEDEVTDQIEMMWETDESHFKEAASEIPEPEI